MYLFIENIVYTYIHSHIQNGEGLGGIMAKMLDLQH